MVDMLNMSMELTLNESLRVTTNVPTSTERGYDTSTRPARSDVTENVPDEADDAIWIMTSTFIIFTMQSGFGLLESGSVTKKNEVNIMMKNAADVIFGGFTYWAFGYAFSFGRDYSNPFCGWGNFFMVTSGHEFGPVYTKFFFQASFATTATTIVSGAMAERTRLESYILFSLLNTLIYSFPAHWVWEENGWLYRLVGGTTKIAYVASGGGGSN